MTQSETFSQPTLDTTCAHEKKIQHMQFCKLPLDGDKLEKIKVKLITLLYK